MVKLTRAVIHRRQRGLYELYLPQNKTFAEGVMFANISDAKRYLKNAKIKRVYSEWFGV
jgi:hypothetical protein